MNAWFDDANSTICRVDLRCSITAGHDRMSGVDAQTEVWRTFEDRVRLGGSLDVGGGVRMQRGTQPALAAEARRALEPRGGVVELSGRQTVAGELVGTPRDHGAFGPLRIGEQDDAASRRGEYLRRAFEVAKVCAKCFLVVEVQWEERRDELHVERLDHPARARAVLGEIPWRASFERAISHRRHRLEERFRRDQIGTVDRLFPDAPGHRRGCETDSAHATAFTERPAVPKRTARRERRMMRGSIRARPRTSNDAASSIEASAFTSGVIPNLICV